MRMLYLALAIIGAVLPYMFHQRSREKGPRPVLFIAL